jgi:hypothetical protein
VQASSAPSCPNVSSSAAARASVPYPWPCSLWVIQDPVPTERTRAKSFAQMSWTPIGRPPR